MHAEMVAFQDLWMDCSTAEERSRKVQGSVLLYSRVLQDWYLQLVFPRPRSFSLFAASIK